MVPHCCLNQDAPLCSRGGQQAPTSPLPTSPPPLGLCWTPHVWRSSAPSHPHCPLLQWRPEILAAARAYPCQARRPLVCVCVCVCVCACLPTAAQLQAPNAAAANSEKRPCSPLWPCPKSDIHFPARRCSDDAPDAVKRYCVNSSPRFAIEI